MKAKLLDKQTIKVITIVVLCIIFLLTTLFNKDFSIVTLLSTIK